mmetsp:Transcript_18936/g.44133  ORF Transcript_18936/g.44133 Transcript_18936/m.44133 type:complete len:230 (+) Transcript_18936:904-1593(+)
MQHLPRCHVWASQDGLKLIWLCIGPSRDSQGKHPKGHQGGHQSHGQCIRFVVCHCCTEGCVHQEGHRKDRKLERGDCMALLAGVIRESHQRHAEGSNAQRGKGKEQRKKSHVCIRVHAVENRADHRCCQSFHCLHQTNRAAFVLRKVLDTGGDSSIVTVAQAVAEHAKKKYHNWKRNVAVANGKEDNYASYGKNQCTGRNRNMGAELVRHQASIHANEVSEVFCQSQCV